jgi:hypothetical protein
MTEPPEKPPANTLFDNPPAPRSRGSLIWAGALIVVALVIVGGLLVMVFKGCESLDKAAATPHDLATDTERIGSKIVEHLEGLAGRVYDHIQGGLKPLVTVRSSVTSQFTHLDNTPKLVVLTATQDVLVTRTSEKRTLWGLLNLGTTEVQLKVPDNKVQFYVPISHLTAEDFSYDAARRRVVIRVPEPVLDRDIVEVQSDPGQIQVRTSVGWARLSSYSGKSVETQARAALRDEVVKAADTQPMHKMARVEAEQILRGFFTDLASSLQEGVRLEFEFKPAVTPTSTKTGTPTKTSKKGVK